MTIKGQGFMDFLIQSEGILQFKVFFKNISNVRMMKIEDFTVALNSIYLLVDLC